MGEKITLIIGVSTFIGGIIQLYGAMLRKRFSAERAVAHMERNYAGLILNIEALSTIHDDNFDELKERLMKIELQQSLLLSASGVHLPKQLEPGR